MKGAWKKVLRGLYGTVVGLITIGCALNTSMAAEEKGYSLLFPWSKVKNTSAGNGIAVDQPKVFDNRSLVLMVEQLDAALARVTAVDQAKLAQSIGLLQGIRESEVSRSLSVSTLPLPGTQLTEQRDTNSGALVPQQRQTTSGSFTPAAPTLAAESLPGISQSGYGIAAQDILSEEVNLTYQILNLRMLLERSITDRTHKDSNGEVGPRAQAVLGFQVSLDPMRQHKDCAAIVEIELSRENGTRAPSLVSLMPQAKTYNVAALSRKVNAFGAAAVVKVVTIGYSERHTGQSYYLYRDTDTVALQRPTAGDKLVFGWEFRPVLGRAAVEPGIRQLFAVVALDEMDSLNSGGDFKINVRTRTYWAKFDQKRAVISSNPCDEYKPNVRPLPIPRSQTIQHSLGPRVEKVELKPAGEGSVLIDVSGDNFYNGTTAIVGGKMLDSSNRALLIKDDHFLQIVATASDLAKGGVLLRGRYGLSAELLDRSVVTNSAAMPDPFDFQVIYSPPVEKQNSTVTLKLCRRGSKATPPDIKGRTVTVTPTAASSQPPPLPPPDIKGRTVIVTVGQQAFALEPTAWRTNEPESCLESYLQVAPESLQDNTLASVSIPFLPDRYSSITLSRPFTVDRAVVLLDGDPRVFGIIGTGFDEHTITNAQTAVIADREYTVKSGLERKGRNLLTISVPKAQAASVKNLIVKLANFPPVVLAAPSVTGPPAKMTLKGDPVPAANVESAPAVEFVGENLEQVAKVRFGSRSLAFSPEDDGKKLRVFLSREATAKAGRVSLAVEGKDGKILTANVDVK